LYNYVIPLSHNLQYDSYQVSG